MSERNFAAGLADDARMIDRPYQWRKQWLATWESDARRKGRDAGRIYALPSMKAGVATTENCMSAPQMFQSGSIVPARAAENRTGWGLQVRCGASGVDEMRSGLGGGTCARMVALAAALQQRAGLAVALVEVVEQVAEVAEMTDGARQASVNLWQPLGRSRSRTCRKRGDELRPDATGGDEGKSGRQRTLAGWMESVYTDVGEWWSGGKEQEKGERDQVEVARGPQEERRWNPRLALELRRMRHVIEKVKEADACMEVESPRTRQSQQSRREIGATGDSVPARNGDQQCAWGPEAWRFNRPARLGASARRRSGPALAPVASRPGRPRSVRCDQSREPRNRGTAEFLHCWLHDATLTG
ncbi:hypothetical protein L1887_49916 [Cichorium endivia]|nr:hypothetical protein L1887_49916 [Cichorium endivia]